MKPVSMALSAAAALLACASAFAGEKPASPRYSFTLNGRGFAPAVWSLEGDPANPGPGDVAVVDYTAVVLGEPGAYAFRATDEKEGKIFLSVDGGPEALAAVKVGWTYEDRTRVVIDPFSGLGTDQIKGLRGLVLAEWPEGVAEKLSGLDFGKCCVTVTQDIAGKARTLPALPPGLMYLRVDESSSEGITDYSSLSALPKLLFLRVRRISNEQFDSELLSGAKGLKHLSLAGNDVTDFEVLGAFTDLRHLDLSWCEYLDDLGFARSMKKLRYLRIVNTGLTDLLPLADMPSIRHVVANQSPLFKLPEGEVPSLRKLEIMSTRLSSLVVDFFREKNPKCVVLHGWAEVFRQAVEGATRIRVRSGGTCHRDEANERTLFEVTDGAGIEEVLNNLVINERESGFHCMCCGEPSFEFYKGDALLATIGYHHGKSLRWPDGWPADAMLTPNSAAFFNKWLLAHGVTGPADEAEEERRRQAALRLRFVRYEEVLGEELLRKAMVAGPGGMLSVFKTQVADPVARASYYLRLFGVDLAYWGITAGLDGPVSGTLLPDVSPGDLEKAILSLVDDPWGWNGAARWVFNEREYKRFDREALERLVPALAPVALTHPREQNRRTVMAVLGSIGGDGALRVLRSVLAGEFQPAAFGPKEDQEPGGMVSWRSEGVSAPTGCSDKAYAAVVLAKMKDTESLETIRKLHEESAGKDKEAYAKALDDFKK